MLSYKTTIDILKDLVNSNNLPSANSLRGADLQGVNLAGQTISHISLRDANLDGADLTGARLSHIDLSGASLRGACLDKTQLRFITAEYSILIGASGKHGSWQHINFSKANLSETKLCSGMLYLCDLESAILDRADLSNTMIISSICDKASFRNTLMASSNTFASKFNRADFQGARDFFACREIVVEILSRKINGSFQMANLIGAASLNYKWCYSEWKQLLDDNAEYRELAFKIFQDYPESGFTEALREGKPPLPYNCR